MELQQHKSGLVIPKQKEEPKKPWRGHVLELRDNDKRERAKKVLLQLWDIMELSDTGYSGIHLPNEISKEASQSYWLAYHHIGDLLLGKDCPEKEQLT